MQSNRDNSSMRVLLLHWGSTKIFLRNTSFWTFFSNTRLSCVTRHRCKLRSSRAADSEDTENKLQKCEQISATAKQLEHTVRLCDGMATLAKDFGTTQKVGRKGLRIIICYHDRPICIEKQTTPNTHRVPKYTASEPMIQTWLRFDSLLAEWSNHQKHSMSCLEESWRVAKDHKAVLFCNYWSTHSREQTSLQKKCHRNVLDW